MGSFHWTGLIEEAKGNLVTAKSDGAIVKVKIPSHLLKQILKELFGDEDLKSQGALINSDLVVNVREGEKNE